MERSQRFAGTACPCSGKCPLGAEERKTRGKEAPGYLGGPTAIAVKLSLIPAAVMLVSTVPYVGWHHSYQLGLSELICELSLNTHRSKKCKGNRYSRRRKAGKMLCVWQALLLICSCFALSYLLRLKKNKQTTLPAEANRREVVGRGFVSQSQGLPSGSRASQGPQCRDWGQLVGAVVGSPAQPGQR